MKILPNDIADKVESFAGAGASAYMQKYAVGSTKFMINQGEALQVLDKQANVKVSTEDPILDLGGRHPNESWLAAPLSALGSNILEVASSKVGYAVTDDNSAGFLLTHRFIDAGATNHSSSLIVTNSSGVVLCTANPNNQAVTCLFMDKAGARELKQARGTREGFRRRIERITPDRSKFQDTDLAAVYATEEGRLKRIPIIRRTPIVSPFTSGDTFIVGGTQERLVLKGLRYPEDTGANNNSYTGPEVEHGVRVYQASLSSFAAPVGTVSSSPPLYPYPADAPAGYYWGDPYGTLNCSRSNQDNCLSCCDTMMAVYGGAATTAAISGAVAGAGTFGTAAVVGLFIGAGILLVGFVHMEFLCRDECRTLYNGRGQNINRRGFRLTAAEYSKEGDQIAYQVYDEDLGVSAKWSKAAVMQLVWSGVRVYIDMDGQSSFVKIVQRRPTPYLRSERDRRLINNLSALPQA